MMVYGCSSVRLRDVFITFIALMSVQQMMKKNAIAKVSFRYGSMDALGSSFAHLLGCCNITAEVANARDLQGARNQTVNFK